MELNAVTVELAKLDLKPGNILAVKSTRLLNKEQYEMIASNLQQLVPEGVKIAIIDADLEFQVFETPPQE